MRNLLLSLWLICTYGVITDAASCESGWTAYKDEICVKSFPNALSYDDAKGLCSSQGVGVSLVMIKDAEMQQFVSNYTKDYFDHLWLGSRYHDNSAEFIWEDGESLSFTNWAAGFPRNTSSSERCIQLQPDNSKATKNPEGKWEDAACQRRNLPICQRTMNWSLEDATREILALRKELLATKQDLETTQVSLITVNDRIVPVGSIYVEYFNQPAPTTLWPTLIWQDITSTYSGLFFRALGETSENWGIVQEACSPRITQVQFDAGNPTADLIELPKSGWSNRVRAGVFGSWHNTEDMTFFTEYCDVRPKNQAIRIWKRLE